ncbi:Holliday junction branch migration protein RuvA [Kosmotoga pacifica]|uniref:Holliday junction branch migration complex subunit RuvA n=1 Tax=Kosmotoga pacifica TaxID=1330330 RepID=A0A0G2ZBD6_9BACT|nr:Holliday junction branch migration protein RuvA [Kosmotoga pacifica]AKI96884.1 hypothetical protein IX53_02540 [Kosmotoga pacifica]
MLEGLEGTVVKIRENYILVKSGPFTFGMNCSISTTERLKVGEHYNFNTYLAFYQDRAPELYGFVSTEELEVFSALIKANKIGPRLALKILSGTTPDKLKALIASRNIEGLSNLPGLGKKTAERLIAEIGHLFENEKIGESLASNDSRVDDALNALVSLGFDRRISSRVLSDILKVTPDIEVNELIKEALKKIR